MKIAIAGKGGSGKTTIAGILTRVLANGGHKVWAIDADSNPNLGVTIGLPPEKARGMQPMPSKILKEITNEKGERALKLDMPAGEVVRKYGLPVSDRLTLLSMGSVDHAGVGCMCGGHARVRTLLSGIIDEQDEAVTVVDMEAGLEHLSRGTDRHVDVLIAVAEPYFKALETARRVFELGRELGIPRVVALANKFRSENELQVVRDYARQHSMPLIAEIPFDGEVQRADLAAEAPALDAKGRAVRAIEKMVDELGVARATQTV